MNHIMPFVYLIRWDIIQKKIEEGKILTHIGQLLKAQNLFKTLLTKNPTQTQRDEILLELANVFILLGKYENVEELLNKINAHGDNKGRIKYLKGVCSLGVDKLKEARKHLWRSLFYSKNNLLQQCLIRLQMAQYLAILGAFEKQFQQLEKIAFLLSKKTGRSKKKLFDLSKKEKRRLKDLALIIADLAEHYGFYYGNTHDIKTAKQYHEKALTIRKSLFEKENPNHYLIAICYNNLGFCYRKQHDFNQSIELHLKSKMQLEKEGFTAENYYYFARIYFNLGISYRDLTQYRKALEAFEICIKIRSLFFGKAHRYLAKAYISRGITFQKQGNCVAASKSFKKALELIASIKSITEHHPNIAKIYDHLGYASYIIGDYKKALTYYKTALNIIEVVIYQNGQVSEKKMESRILCHIGQTYRKLEQFNKAIHCFDKALALVIVLNLSFDEGICYFNLGATYFENKNYSESIKYHKKALPIYLKSLKKQDPRLLKLYNFLAEAYLYGKEMDKVFRTYRKAEKVFLEGYQIAIQKKYKPIIGLLNILPHHLQLILRDFELAKEVNKRRIFETWVGLAKFNYFKYKETKDVIFLKKGLLYFTSYIINITDNMLNTCNPVELRRSFALKCKNAYGMAVEMAFLLYEAYPDKKEYIKNAYEFIEKSKNAILAYDLLALLIKQQNIDKDLLNKIDDLAYRIADIERNMLEVENDEEEKSMSATEWSSYRNELVEELEDKKKILREKHPEYYQLKYKREIISIEKVQKNLKNRSIILNYFCTQSEVFLITITTNKVLFKQLTSSDFDISLFKRAVKNFKDGLWHNVLNKFHFAAANLYEMLIKPIEEVLEENAQLVILPDEDLHNMPFAALVRKKYDWNLPKLKANELDYFIKKWGLFYQFSTTFLFYDEMLGITTQRLRNKTFGGFSVSNHSHDEDFKNAPPLLKTIEEVQKIKSLFLRRGLKAKIWENATKKSFLKKAAQFQYLLIATHSGKEKNNQPCLIFANDGERKHRLTLEEFIEKVKLLTDLVILNSCSAGSGEIYAGEGVVSLSKAVLYAGATSCISTFHNVGDSVAAQFSQTLMKRIAIDELGRIESTRQALIGLIEDEDIEPREWAVFFLKSKWKCKH